MAKGREIKVWVSDRSVDAGQFFVSRHLPMGHTPEKPGHYQSRHPHHPRQAEEEEGKMSNEQIYFDALKKIARDFETPDRLRKMAERGYGLDAAEAIEMAYENMQILAADTIRGKRRPKP